MENVNYKKKPKQRIRKYGKFNSVKESMNKIVFIRAFTLVSLKFSSLFIIRIFPFCLFYFIFHLTTFLPTLVLFYFYFFHLTTFLEHQYINSHTACITYRGRKSWIYLE